MGCCISNNYKLLVNSKKTRTNANGTLIPDYKGFPSTYFLNNAKDNKKSIPVRKNTSAR